LLDAAALASESYDAHKHRRSPRTGDLTWGYHHDDVSADAVLLTSIAQLYYDLFWSEDGPPYKSIGPLPAPISVPKFKEAVADVRKARSNFRDLKKLKLILAELEGNLQN
jgi:hypothetical protein